MNNDLVEKLNDSVQTLKEKDEMLREAKLENFNLMYHQKSKRYALEGQIDSIKHDKFEKKTVLLET